MISRERIEDVLERNKDGFPVLSVDELDELCRAYLAWLDAPDVVVEYEAAGTIGAKITGGPIGSEACPRSMIGKSFRLVEGK